MDSSKVYLVQTDTTVGFLCSNSKKLSVIKQRPVNQKTLQVVDSFQTLKNHTRVPKKFRNLVRRAKNTTFIYPKGLSFRVIPNNSTHNEFVKKFKIIYSTSANITKQNFNRDFAKNKVDVIVEDKNGFFEANSSKLIKLSCNKIKKIR